MAGRSVVVTGGAGVGKSALLRATGHQHSEAGWEAHRVVGSLAARDMHLAAVARLVPLDGSQRPHELIASTVAHLRRLAAEGPQLLVVDDAHLLDAGSAVLLQELVVDGAVAVLCAVRHGEDCPDPVVRLWKDDHARHLELGPLPRPEAAALLTTLLEGPVGPSLEAELWRLTRGNPLFLEEFVLALHDDELQSDDGVWVATRQLPGSRRLADVVNLRLRNLDPADRDALELVSVGEPLPLRVAVDLLGQTRMERLESLQLATVDVEVGQLRPSHPMHGEVLREVMPPTRRSALASRIADALVATDPEDPELLVRTAATLLDAGRPPPADLALRSAEAARAIGDLRLAARVARHALDAHPVAGASSWDGCGTIAWGCDLLHDAVRLGRPAEVLDLLEQHAAGTQFTIAELHARHARALADGDTDALGEVGSGLAGAGCPLQAAEAWAQAAAHHRDAGDDPAAARAATRAQLLADGCTGVPTPPLTAVDDLGVSPREREVIDLALAGASNRTIADALVLSQRTVENHRSRVYGRLEVAGRAGLAALTHGAGADDRSGPA